MKIFILTLLLFISHFSFTQTKEKAASSNIQVVHNTLSFIENKGQWDEDILFKSSFKGGNLWIQRNKFLFHLQDFQQLKNSHANFSNTDTTLQNKQHVVHLNFKNSNSITRLVKQNPSNNDFHFFMGKDSKKWISNVKTYTDATLLDIYPGIDIHLIQEDEELKYEFIVSPFANPADIQLEIAGSTHLKVDNLGRLNIQTPLGTILENKPFVYQMVKGVKTEIASEFEIDNGIVFFKLGAYSKNLPLIIDPVLVFATYDGSYSDNFGMTATYGNDGTAYSGGTVFGNAYPTPDKNVFNIKTNFTVSGGVDPSDVFISKYSADGSTMLWTAFIGGGDNYSGTETVHSLICDKDNNVYAFGATSSPDFPTTTNAFQKTHAGGSTFNAFKNGAIFGDFGVDMFALKISADGHQLIGSTLIGGSNNDGINTNITGINSNYNGAVYYDSLTSNYGDQFRGEIMLDKFNNVVIASSSRSSDFPMVNAAQSTLLGQQDGVIIKLKNDFSQLLFSTFIGGKDNDALYSVKIDSSDNIVFCGGTSSNNLPTSLSAYQKTYGGGKCDGFIGKLSPDGKQIKYLTYLGLSNFDQTFLLEINNQNHVFVVGHSLGGNFPIIQANYVNPNSAQFIAELDSTLSNLVHATVYGNGNKNVTNVSPAAFLVDDCGNIYVSGWGANLMVNTPLNGMPVTNGSVPPNGFDFHLFVLDRSFNKIIYGSYLGGNKSKEHVDGGTSRFDKNGNVYQSVCGGCGGHSDFPVTKNAWSSTNNSDNCNNLIFKFAFELTPTAKLTVSKDTACLPVQVIYENKSINNDNFIWDFGNGELDSTSMKITKNYTIQGNYPVKLLVKNTICKLSDTAYFTNTIVDSIRYDKLIDVEFCTPTNTNFITNSYGTATQYTWSNVNTFIPSLKNSSDSTFSLNVDSTHLLFYKISNGTCDKVDSVYVSVINSTFKLIGDTSICIKDPDSLYCKLKSINQTFTFDWSPKKFITSYPSYNSVILHPDTSLMVYVQAIGSAGCILKDSLKINLTSWNLFNTKASADTTYVIKGDNVKLFAEPNGYSYTWNPELNILQSNSQNTEAKMWENTIFKVTISDGNCTVSDTILIKVIPWVCDFPYVFVPNAFSPNGDSENDVLYVRGHPIKKIEFRIFNRWGEMVFESKDINIGWDGTYKGKLCDPDVFDYYLNVECVGEEHNQIQGNITILR